VTIDGLTVCVNYADLLALSLNRWLAALDTITIVTTPADVDTIELADATNWRQPYTKAFCYKTHAFTAGGADFNKGAAMQEAISQMMPWGQWIAFFDADIIPPPHLRQLLEQAGLEPGNLYGGVRHIAESADDYGKDPLELPVVRGRGQRIPGAFQLFHAGDPAVGDRRQLLDVTWRHAGNYDSAFQARWPRERQIVLEDVHYIHIGEPGLNWHGRCSPDEGRRRKAARDAARKAHGGSCTHERIDPA